jgi:hypothetical protein
MAASIKGGCACSTVRYEASADPLFAGTCHCRDCQRASGGGSGSVIAVPKNALKVTGEVKYHEVTAESGNKISRGFCPSCGSPVFVRPAVINDAVLITLGSLDDSSWVKPAMELYTSSAQPWDHLSPDLPKFPKMPPPPSA